MRSPGLFRFGGRPRGVISRHAAATRARIPKGIAASGCDGETHIGGAHEPSDSPANGRETQSCLRRSSVHTTAHTHSTSTS
jgi:hypothetical protein